MKKNKKNNKISLNLILFLILIITFVFATFSFARYRQTTGAGIDTNLAKWTFKLYDNETQTFSIDLAECKQASRSRTEGNEVIKPGDKGTFIIELDFTDAEVAIDYEMIFTKSGEGKIPSNLNLNIQNEDGTVTDLKTTSLKGTKTLEQIQESPIEEIVVRWSWTIDNITDESQYQGTNFSYNAQIIGIQKY